MKNTLMANEQIPAAAPKLDESQLAAEKLMVGLRKAREADEKRRLENISIERYNPKRQVEVGYLGINNGLMGLYM